MSRKLKNILMIIGIVILCGALGFTIYQAKNNSAPTMNQMSQGNQEMGTPPDQTNGDQSNNSGNTSGENTQTPPAKPDGENGQTPPNMTDSQNIAQGEGSQPGQNGGNAPEMPDGNGGNAPEMPDGQQMSEGGAMGGNGIQTIYYVFFGIEGLFISALLLFLILSQGNKKTFKETFSNQKNIIIAVIAILLITAGITWGSGVLTQKMMTSGSPGSNQGEANNVSENATAVKIVDGNTETLTESYESKEADVSAILVKNKGTATITGATINKSAGDSSNTENSEFYGINAALLVTKNSTATIKNATITTAAKGANAVFATGENAKISISDSTITSTGSSSARGLDATYGGTIEADNVTITTQGGSCATLATDRGEGTVSAKNSNLTTNGAGSPVIYSTGTISVENTTGVANGSQIAVIEGKNTANITNSKLSCAANGNRGDVDVAGVMIYQSMSGDASEGTGTLTAKDSELSILTSSGYYKTAPMFFVTNTEAVINLENTKLNFGSSILLSAKGTDEWGKSGSNGGKVTLNASNQTLSGNIILDNLSELTFTLKYSSYEGTINGDQTAKSVKLTLDKNSKIKLTGDCYVTEFENSDSSNSNIDFNGHTLYVNGEAIK